MNKKRKRQFMFIIYILIIVAFICIMIKTEGHMFRPLQYLIWFLFIISFSRVMNQLGNFIMKLIKGDKK